MNDIEEYQDPSDDAVIGKALIVSASAIVGFAIVIGAVIWFLNKPDKPQVNDRESIDLPDERTASSVELPSIRFTDITSEAGIRFQHQNGATGEKLLPETMGGGCAFLDVDDDGDQDLVLINSKQWAWNPKEDRETARSALYLNDGTGKFTDVSKAWGLDVSMYGMGVAAGDYDGDSDIDLFLTAVGKNRLLRNEGDKFVDVTEQAHVGGNESAWSTSCAWFDYDRDGDLDLFVCNYVRWTREIDEAQNFQLTGIGRAYGPPTAFEGSYSYLYQNNGDGTFQDVSKKSGIEQQNRSTGAPLGKSLGVVPFDLNQDGWLDLVVANDTVRNFVFMNQKDGTFKESGIELGVAFDSQGKARGAMGIDVARFRNDACIGVAIANFANEMTGLYVCTPPNLFFTDDAIPTGLGPPTRLDLSFGLLFADFDLDGRLDLLSANGHLENEINQVQSSQHYQQPTRLFWNAGEEGSSEFVQLGEQQLGPDFGTPVVGRGASCADIDGDGDLDVLVTQIGGTPLLLRNDQDCKHNFVRLRLVPQQGTAAFGAKVQLELDGRRISRHLTVNRSYLSQTEPIVTIGIGKLDVDTVSATIDWPNGRSQATSLQVNQLNVVEFAD